MANKKTRIVLCACLFLLALSVAFLIYCWNIPRSVTHKIYSASREANATKVLYIGNSLTFFFDSPDLLCKVLRLMKKDTPINVESATGPGYTLLEHLSDPTTLAAIKKKKWDYVILQEGSQSAFDRRHESLYAHRRFVDMVRASGGKPLIVMLFADKGHFYWQGRLSQHFRAVGRELKTPVIPFGDVVFFSQVRHPKLDLYDRDEHHPGEVGALLYALLVAQHVNGFSSGDLQEETKGSNLDLKNGFNKAQSARLIKLRGVLEEWEKEGANAPIYTEVSDDENSTVAECWLRRKMFDRVVALYRQEAKSAETMFGDSAKPPLATCYWRLADAMIKQIDDDASLNGSAVDKNALATACESLRKAIDIYKSSGSFDKNTISDAEGYLKDVQLRHGVGQ